MLELYEDDRNIKNTYDLGLFGTLLVTLFNVTFIFQSIIVERVHIMGETFGPRKTIHKNFFRTKNSNTSRF